MNTMQGYLTPDLLGGSYLYSSTSSANATFSYVVSLTMSVDRGMLEHAVNELMPRFPQFAVTVKRGEDSYSFVRQEDPVRVFRFGEREEFLLSDTFPGTHLFLISCEGKTVHFDFHRCLADEKGALVFMESVIFRYIRNIGYDIENDGSILAPDTAFMDAEAEDSFVRLDDIPASRPVWYMDAQAFSFPDVRKGGAEHVVQIRLPLSKIKGEAKGWCNMPAALIPPFFSDVLLHSGRDRISAGEYVIAAIQVSLRKYFPTPSLRPFFVDIPLAYNRKLSEYPVNTVLMSQKKMIEAQIRTDALAYKAQKEISLLEKAGGKKTAAAKISAIRDLFLDKAKAATYSFSNIGNIIMPESMLQFVTEFYPVIPATLYPFSLSTVIFKGDMVITVASASDKTEEISRDFARLLKQYNMHAFISDEFDYLPLHYKPE